MQEIMNWTYISDECHMVYILIPCCPWSEVPTFVFVLTLWRPTYFSLTVNNKLCCCLDPRQKRCTNNSFVEIVLKQSHCVGFFLSLCLCQRRTNDICVSSLSSSQNFNILMIICCFLPFIFLRGWRQRSSACDTAVVSNMELLKRKKNWERLQICQCFVREIRMNLDLSAMTDAIKIHHATHNAYSTQACESFTMLEPDVGGMWSAVLCLCSQQAFSVTSPQASTWWIS